MPPLRFPVCTGGSVLTPHSFLPESNPVPTPTGIKTAPHIAIRCHFPSNYPSCQLDLQISNLSTQPTHFASCQLNPPSFFHVDMFPLTANFLFFGRVALCPKSTPSQESLVFKPFSYIYFSTFDINTTHSTVLSLSQQSSCVSLSPKYTGKRNFMCFRNLPSGCSCS